MPPAPTVRAVRTAVVPANRMGTWLGNFVADLHAEGASPS
jgi:hypothetical protein